MSEYDNVTNSQPYLEDLQPRRRQCRIGDTVSAARGSPEAEHTHWRVEHQESLTAVNDWLIPSGRCRVSRCGRCGNGVEECACDLSES